MRRGRRALLRAVCLLLALQGMASAAFGAEEHFAPAPPGPDTALFRSYPYGNYLADAARQAGRTDIAVIPNGDVDRTLRGEAVPLAEASLPEPQFAALLERELSSVTVDGEREIIVSAGADLDPFWQIAGFRLQYDPTAPVGDRVVSLRTETGEPWSRWPVTVTAPVSVFSEAGFDAEPLDVTLEEAAALYESDDDADIVDARIRPLGTVDNSFVGMFPRWAVILLPLLAAALLLMARRQSRKYRDAHGVFLDRKERDRL